ncbi:MAG: hypothetical protein GX859_13490 [Corynebacterium humireducens]|uniref:Secreted protein n=1 Tax=Corynebacterium humireducens TaxID=1223514 RepID=A0A7X6PQZ9_9CORY|nr:hypothetical protein [Corynebacterium humireducens]
MSKTIFTGVAATATALLLTACGAGGGEFDDMDEWLAEVEESTIVCEQVHRIGEGADEGGAEAQGEETTEIQSDFGIISFADCFQEDGTASMRMFDSEESNVDRIDALREQPEYDVNTPAVLKGDAWAVDCTSVELCEQWAEHFDGEVLVAPDF